MDTELREDWEDALASGLFKQGRRSLNAGGEYCCLGVLCEVAISRGMPVERVDISDFERPGLPLYAYRLAGSENEDYTLLTDELLELFDISDYTQEYLANLNDQGRTFADIVTVLNGTATAEDDEAAFDAHKALVSL